MARIFFNFSFNNVVFINHLTINQTATGLTRHRMFMLEEKDKEEEEREEEEEKEEKEEEE